MLYTEDEWNKYIHSIRDDEQFFEPEELHVPFKNSNSAQNLESRIEQFNEEEIEFHSAYAENVTEEEVIVQENNEETDNEEDILDDVVEEEVVNNEGRYNSRNNHNFEPMTLRPRKPRNYLSIGIHYVPQKKRIFVILSLLMTVLKLYEKRILIVQNG
jgi:hypothetical protein